MLGFPLLFQLHALFLAVPYYSKNYASIMCTSLGLSCSCYVEARNCYHILSCTNYEQEVYTTIVHMHTETARIHVSCIVTARSLTLTVVP